MEGTSEVLTSSPPRPSVPPDFPGSQREMVGLLEEGVSLKGLGCGRQRNSPTVVHILILGTVTVSSHGKRLFPGVLKDLCRGDILAFLCGPNVTPSVLIGGKWESQKEK